jgi:DNA-binding transcriptional ArsR family regulator
MVRRASNHAGGILAMDTGEHRRGEMSADPNLAEVASLIGEPARAAMLLALLGGQALPAGELAGRAGVTPQTASTHLARLVDGGLVQASSSGRHRYYRLRSGEIGAVLEALLTIAPARPVRSLRQSEEARALRAARTCYDHLAGALGVALTRRLLALELLIREGEQFHLTAAGAAWLPDWGIDLDGLRRGRRALARPCLDWSERHDHLAGSLGAALAATLFARGWLLRVPGSRAVRLTPEGEAGLQHELGVTLSTPGAEIDRGRAPAQAYRG